LWLLVFLRSVRRLLVAASVVPSSPNLVTLMKEALSSSETSVLTRATRRNISGYAIFHCYIYMKTVFTLLISLEFILLVNVYKNYINGVPRVMIGLVNPRDTERVERLAVDFSSYLSCAAINKRTFFFFGKCV
jgi:hypothetical protein